MDESWRRAGRLISLLHAFQYGLGSGLIVCIYLDSMSINFDIQDAVKISNTYTSEDDIGFRCSIGQDIKVCVASNERVNAQRS